MSNYHVTPVVGILAVSAALMSTVSQAADATATASATVIAPIQIAKQTDLAFGSFAATSVAGSVIIAPGGGVTTSNVSLVSGSTNAASFTVSGAASTAYSITLPLNNTVTIDSGGDSMDVNSFTSDPSGTGTLSAGGADTLNVGATLEVGANQPAGTYTGTFDVTVEYN